MSKYTNYYEQLSSTKVFPVDIKAINTEEVVTALQRLIRKENLPLVAKRKQGRITINKKADA